MKSAYPTESILITGDIFQTTRFIENAFVANESLNNLLAESLFHLLRLPASWGSGLPVRLLRPAEVEAQVRQARDALCAGSGAFCRDTYTALLHAKPTGEVAEVFVSVFKGTFVVGFDLSPLMIRILTRLSIPWINITIYPLACFDDIALSLASNLAPIAELLRQRMIPQERAAMAVAVQNARYMPMVRHFANRFPENSILLMPQGPLDHPALNAAGGFASFADFLPRLERLRRKHAQFYVYWHDAETLPKDLRAAMRALDAVPLPPEMSRRPLGLFFSHPCITGVAGICCASLAEAALYGKKTLPFVPYHTRHAHVVGLETAADAPESFPVGKECFTPEFWHDLCAAIMPAPVPRIQAEPPPRLNLRLILRGAGADFDDAQSYRHCQVLGGHDYRIKQLEERIDVLTLALECRGAPATDRGAVSAVAIKGQSRIAAFAVGNGSYVLPSIVALRSLQARSGISDLFYFSDEKCICEDDLATLREFGITPVLSPYGRQFSSSYVPHAHALAYLIFRAPQILNEKGYQHSIGVQGDTLCIRPFDPDAIFADTPFITGAHTIPMCRSIVFQNIEKVKQIPGVQEHLLHRQVANPGVLFFNNPALAGFRLADVAAEAFARIGQDALLYNEESLLMLVSLLHEDMLRLIDGAYNFLQPSALCKEPPVFLHFSARKKPWNDQGYARNPGDVGCLYDAAVLWRDAAKEILGPVLYESLRARTCEAFHV